MYNLNLKKEPKALINFKIGEKFIVSRTGNVCRVFNKNDIANIEIYNETTKKKGYIFREVLGTSNTQYIRLIVQIELSINKDDIYLHYFYLYRLIIF